MKYSLLIKTNSLKDFLNIFSRESVIKELVFGDTWHPSSGYIDENILEGKNSVKDILDFPYDFKGLIYFKGEIGNLKLEYISERDTYKIIGTDYKIRNIKNKSP